VPDGLLLAFTFALGCCIGSFLNVVVYRLPREESIVRPRSRCTSCKRPIAWFDNIPLISYVALGGKCRHCRKGFSARYPAIELLTGLAMTAVIARFGFNAVGWIYAAFLAALIAASFIDLEFQIIPDEISLGGMAVGLVLSLLVPALHGADSPWLGLWRSALGLLVGGGVLYGTGLLGDFLFKKESMGGGDIKLLAMAGTILGWQLALVAFFLAPMLAVIPGLIVLFVKKSHVIPYGPFLSLALVVAMVWGYDLLRVSGIDESMRLLWEYRPWFR
jgi:leader peptidase (prepilin peptidase)/N-methyltransferase